MRLGYLYSRYPVISQTFCDAEMLALERRGIELVIGSVYPPLTSLRHEYIARLRAPIHYAPPQEILRILERDAKTTRKWPRDLVEQHDRKYGPGPRQNSGRAMPCTLPSSLPAAAWIMCTCISQIAPRTPRFS